MTGLSLDGRSIANCGLGPPLAENAGFLHAVPTTGKECPVCVVPATAAGPEASYLQG